MKSSHLLLIILYSLRAPCVAPVIALFFLLLNSLLTSVNIACFMLSGINLEHRGVQGDPYLVISWSRI